MPAAAGGLRYGDVLVLVRRRGNIFDAIIQALKQAGIPVAGADRLKLTEHIAIIDLMNLADALLLPQDDLALAVALKSPLFGLTDDDLFELAWGRRGLAAGSTFEAGGAFRQASGGVEAPESLRAPLLASRRRLPSTRGCSAATAGAQRILARLGHEANDALDEFLELALNYERKAPASLQGFMAWLRSADTEVKRDMEISRDEVRVMTVHGAKGLEASCRVHGRHHVVAFRHAAAAPDQRAARQSAARSWSGPAGMADDPKSSPIPRQAMLADTEDEYRRLLYVR